MFTGIVNHQGNISSTARNKLVVESELAKKLTVGDSISVNGICLTVTEKYTDHFVVDFTPETAAKTTILKLAAGDKVNLELPATASTLLSGHIVQGHIDTTASLIKIQKTGNARRLGFKIAEKFGRYIANKGSVAIDGISLTVSSVHGGEFTVHIIPHTWQKTTLNKLRIGDDVNVEVDILAKYIGKLSRRKHEA